MIQSRPAQKFTKMHGAGNDFVVLDNRAETLSIDALSRLAPLWCHRRRGIGADGILALRAPEDTEHNFRMTYLNADGSRATMCGNGARCIARFARSLGIDREPLLMETDAGLYRVSVPDQEDQDVKLFVPPPRDVRLHDIERDGTSLHYVWTGTHHVVIFVDDLLSTDVASIGPQWRHDAHYQPEGANVNFVHIKDADTLRVRTFEKGVEAETEACGTGAIASAVIAEELDYLQGDLAEVHTNGGTLKVGLVDPHFLEGPAEVSFYGEIAINLK